MGSEKQPASLDPRHRQTGERKSSYKLGGRAFRPFSKLSRARAFANPFSLEKEAAGMASSVPGSYCSQFFLLSAVSEALPRKLTWSPKKKLRRICDPEGSGLLTDLQAASEKEEEHPNPCVGVAKEASQSCVCSGNMARGYSSTLTQQQLAMVARWV